MAEKEKILNLNNKLPLILLIEIPSMLKTLQLKSLINCL